MESILSSFIWKAFNWLPGILLRRLFNEHWLKSKIYMDIKPRGIPVEIIQPDNPRVRIQLEIRNDSHFDIVMDRLMIKFMYGIEMAHLTHFKRELIKSGGTLNLSIQGNIDANQFKSLAYYYKEKSRYCALDILSEFNSKIRNFNIERTLDGITPTIMNAQLLDQQNNLDDVQGTKKHPNAN